jgi:hypothetical protein
MLAQLKLHLSSNGMARGSRLFSIVVVVVVVVCVCVFFFFASLSLSCFPLCGCVHFVYFEDT